MSCELVTHVDVDYIQTGFPESDLIHVELKQYVNETKLDTAFAKLLLLLLLQYLTEELFVISLSRFENICINVIIFKYLMLK